MRREHHGTGRAAQYIYMPLEHVYAIGIHHNGAGRIGKHSLHGGKRPGASAQAAANQAGIAAGKPRQNFRNGALCQHAALREKREHHRLEQLPRHDRIHRLRHADEDQSCAGPRRTHGRQRRSARIADSSTQQHDTSEIALVRLARPPREPAAEPLRVHDRNIRHFSFPHLPQCGLFRYDYNVPQKNSQMPGGFPLQPLKKYVKILAIQKKSCDRAAGCRMRAQRGCVAVSTPRRQCRPSPASFRLNVL